jgi:hypothetical protein
MAPLDSSDMDLPLTPEDLCRDPVPLRNDDCPSPYVSCRFTRTRIEQVVEPGGLEPPTPCLSCICSFNGAKSPRS